MPGAEVMDSAARVSNPHLVRVAADQADRFRAVGTCVYTATEDYFRTSDMHDRCRYVAVNGASFSSPSVAGAAALPLGQKPAPSLSTTTALLDAGASQVIVVEFNPIDLAAGDYQGVFRIQGTRGNWIARCPTGARFPAACPVDPVGWRQGR